jgi:MFS superfamily sulfate permease-like transporter
VLASVVFLIGLELVDLAGMKKIRHSGHRPEFIIALATAATVVGWGVEQGIILAIVLSIVQHLRHSYKPQNAVLVKAGTHEFRRVPCAPVPQAVPGLVVFLWGASLYFANAERFGEQVLDIAKSPGLKWLVIDAAAINDVDYTGGEQMIQTSSELKELGVRLAVAGMTAEVKVAVTRAGVVEALGEDAFYPGVDEAVAAFRAAAKGGDSPGSKPQE